MSGPLVLDANVCRAFGVDYLDMIDMLRELSARFILDNNPPEEGSN